MRNSSSSVTRATGASSMPAGGTRALTDEGPSIFLAIASSADHTLSSDVTASCAVLHKASGCTAALRAASLAAAGSSPAASAIPAAALASAFTDRTMRRMAAKKRVSTERLSAYARVWPRKAAWDRSAQ
eukprot:scaffold282388_cov27-Tisochrysis_lutea.AAC.2